MVDASVQIAPELEEILDTVSDPEVPVLTVRDLGVIRKAILENNKVFIELTPTYSGCPAMDTISVDLKEAFEAQGYDTEIKLVLAPAWSTDWISDAGRKKLLEYGIAPPMSDSKDKSALLGNARVVPCPQCASTNTQMISQFGSTACKALFKCEDCLEPFDYFKCLK